MQPNHGKNCWPCLLAMAALLFTAAYAQHFSAAALALPPQGGPEFSDWSAPVNLGPIVNSPFVEAGPAVSKDSLSLYFHSSRPTDPGDVVLDFNIWVAQRPALDSPWGTPVPVPVINTGAFEFTPALSRDGHWLFFVSDRLGGFGGNDIWASFRSNPHDDFGWQPPVNLGPGVNSSSNEAGPGYFENDEVGAPLLFFTSTRPGGPGGADVYVSEQMSDGSFGPATLVAELSSPQTDGRPAIRFDGLELFLQSDRVGTLGGLDLWVATRNTVTEPWSAPVNLGALINTTSSDQQPYIASDPETLFFASNRPGGLGGLDLYAATRTKTKGP